MADISFPPFPHHRLIAYQVALEFVRLISTTPIADAESRKHAREGASSCARNLSEGAGRTSRADKKRVYSIALGEACEAVCSVEIDNALGGCSAEQLRAVHLLGSRLVAMLRPLTR
jgi:four helix bundle protein